MVSVGLLPKIKSNGNLSLLGEPLTDLRGFLGLVAEADTLKSATR